jgi:hypothetical protein
MQNNTSNNSAQNEYICRKISRIAHILLDRGQNKFVSMMMVYKEYDTKHKWCKFCTSVMNRILRAPCCRTLCYNDQEYIHNHIHEMHNIFTSALINGTYDYYKIPKYIKIDINMVRLLIEHNYICAEMDPYIDDNIMIRLIATGRFNTDFTNLESRIRSICEKYGDEIMKLFLQTVVNMTNDEIAETFANFHLRFKYMPVDVQRRYMDAVINVNPQFVITSNDALLNMMRENAFPVENFVRMMAFSKKEMYIGFVYLSINNYLFRSHPDRSELCYYDLRLTEVILSKYEFYTVALIQRCQQQLIQFGYHVTCNVLCPPEYDKELIFLDACVLRPHITAQYLIFLKRHKHAKITCTHLRQIWSAEQSTLNISIESQVSLEDLIYMMGSEISCIDDTTNSQKIIDCLISKWITNNGEWNMRAIIPNNNNRANIIDFAAKLVMKSPFLIKIFNINSVYRILYRIHTRLYDELSFWYRIARKFNVQKDIKDMITIYIINPEINDNTMKLMIAQSFA